MCRCVGGESGGLGNPPHHLPGVRRPVIRRNGPVSSGFVLSGLALKHPLATTKSFSCLF